ncbi:hypothetical protein ABGB08_37415 [Acrocarpospora sp. B8E8]
MVAQLIKKANPKGMPIVYELRVLGPAGAYRPRPSAAGDRWGRGVSRQASGSRRSSVSAETPAASATTAQPSRTAPVPGWWAIGRMLEPILAWLA